MAPTQSTPFTSSTLFISIVIVVSSIVGASSTLLVIVLIVFLRRQLLAARQYAKKKRGRTPKLVITDTSMFPASVVVIEGSAELDKVIASFRPLGYKLPSPGDRPVNDNCRAPKDESDEKIDENTVLPEILVSGARKDILAANHQDSGTLYTFGGPSPRKRPRGVWWYNFHIDDLNEESICTESDESSEDDSAYSSASEPGNLSGPLMKVSVPSSDKTLPETSVKSTTGCRLNTPVATDEDIVQGTPIDRQMVEYCWEILDNSVGELGDNYSTTCNEASPGLETEHADALMLEKPDSAELHDVDPSLEQKMLQHCWTITDHGIRKGLCTSPSSTSTAAGYAMAFGPVPGSP